MDELLASTSTGEQAVARGRVVVVGALCALQFAVLLTDASHPEYRWGIMVSSMALAIAFLIKQLAHRPVRPRSLPMLSSLYDVTMVTLLHVGDLLRDLPSTAVNGRVTFSLYFVAIVGTLVRWDRRVCLAAGIVAGVQYALIVAWSYAIWPDVPTPDVLALGAFDLGVQIERVMTLVIFAWICMRIARRGLDLRASASRDLLTGTYSRQLFIERLHDEILRSARARNPLSVAILDIDHFKLVNDQYGHHAGDAALRAFGKLLRAGLRRTDLVARWGGEEFVVMLPETSEEDAAIKMHQLRELLNRSPIDLGGGVIIKLTASMGIAQMRPGVEDVDRLIKAADQRLLAAKRGGRDRIATTEMPAVG